MTAGTPTVESAPAIASASDAARLASEFLRTLDDKESFSAREFFDRHPACARFKSVVLEVTLEEYIRRNCNGDQAGPAELAAQFPEFHSAVAKQIEVYQLLEDSSGIEDSAGWPAPGDDFLGLKIHELLGVGAFSKVFQATEPAVGGRSVVVKACYGAAAEAAFLGRLGHPHITPIHWHGNCKRTGLSAIVMPYLARSTMADVIDRCFARGRRPEQAADIAAAVEELHSDTDLQSDLAQNSAAFAGTFRDAALRLALQLSDALAFAHGHKICHSDIKPSNVLMTPAGNAVLLDFSMANDLAIDRKTVGGTFPYMAPEQLRAFLAGIDIPVSYASDLFSLGVTLYEFLTGRLPFGHPPANDSRRTVAEWLLSQQKIGVPPVSILNPQISESMSDLVMQCLQVNPIDRPRTAAVLREQLNREKSVSRRMLNVSRRHRKKLLASSAAAIVVASFTVAHALTRPPAYQTALQRAEAALVQHDWTTALSSLTLGIEELPAEVWADGIRSQALFDRGCAQVASGNLDAAAADFAAAMNIERNNGRFIAAVAYCDSRIAFRDLHGDELVTELQLARGRFQQAVESNWETPAVLFNLAYLEFRQELIQKRPSEELRNRDVRRERLQSRFDAITTRLDQLADDLSDHPNYHLLLIEIEREQALLTNAGADHHVTRALQKFPTNRRILVAAACTRALYAGLHDDPQMKAANYADCFELWKRALESDATYTDWEGLGSFNAQVADDPQFLSLVPARDEMVTIAPDRLLSPLDDIESGVSVQLDIAGR